MFSHDIKGGLFSSQADATRKNPKNPNADLFSILDQLEKYRNSDGNFRFKLCYPEVTWGLGGKKCNEWIQSSNPLTETTITGFKPISLAFHLNSGKDPWAGLGKSPSQWSGAAIDDTPTSSGWWYAIGATRLHFGGIPGPRHKNDSVANTGKGGVVKKVQLYVQKQIYQKQDCTCGNGNGRLKNNRIAGGLDVDPPGEFPWQVAFVFK